MMPKWHNHLTYIQSTLSNILIIKSHIFECNSHTQLTQFNNWGGNFYILTLPLPYKAEKLLKISS